MDSLFAQPQKKPLADRMRPTRLSDFVGTGLLYLFTAGLFGVGVLIDLIMLLLGNFSDKFGYPLI